MITIAVLIILFGIIIWFIPRLVLPTLPPDFVTAVAQSIAWLWSFNVAFPVSDFLILGAAGFAFEFGIFIIKLIAVAHSYVSGRNRPKGSV